MNSSEPAVVFVVPGDLHLTEPERDNHRAALWMVDEVNRIIRPDFVQFIGDNVQEATTGQFQLFDEIRRRLTVPHHVLAGDHDVHEDAGGRRFQELVGDFWGSFRVGRFRFLNLCTVEQRPLGFSPEQMEWFRDQVDAARSARQRLVVFQHHYPFKVWETFAGPGVEVWRTIVQTRRIAAIFTGHTHYGQIANDGRNIIIATRSIGDPEGGPPGYTVAFARGDDLAVAYRSVEDSGPLVLVTHPREALLATGPEHVVAGPDVCRARVWSDAPVRAVQGRLDEGPWFALTPLPTEGEWSAPLPTSSRSKGEHVLEIQVEDAADGKGRGQIVFAMDPTGRFTAVPGVRPAVKGTAFC